MYESDANNPTRFHTMPDHIRKILYLDAPDLIVEKDNEPVFSIEVTTEAGTGHNAFQRFARIAAAVENSVPAFYIYPEGAIITRKGSSPGWDEINPLIFHALESVMSVYEIPALLYYFPSDIATHLAKYIENALREDGILTIAMGGIIYSPGSAGTMQEIFQDAVQNHYLSFGYASPMVFLGAEYWTDEMPVYPLLKHLATKGKYRNLLLSLADDECEVVETIKNFSHE